MNKQKYLERHTTEYIKNLFSLSKGRHGKIKKNKIKVIPTTIENEFVVIVKDHQENVFLEFENKELQEFLNTRDHIQRKRNNKGFGHTKKNVKVCPNCNRDAKIVKITEHHLVPQEKGGKTNKDNLMSLCDDCHQQLHTLYDNNYLKKYRNTPERILNDKKMITFSKFIIKLKKSKAKRKQSKQRYRR